VSNLFTRASVRPGVRMAIGQSILNVVIGLPDVRGRWRLPREVARGGSVQRTR
jgi:hypothetical protein